MSIVTIDDSYLTAIGNAIRAKNGTTTTYKPSEMAAAISAIESGDSGLLLSAYWNDALTGAISDDTITKIPNYAFDRSSAVGGDKHEITSVSFPNVLTVGSAAFDYNSTIQTITARHQNRLQRLKRPLKHLKGILLLLAIQPHRLLQRHIKLRVLSTALH